MRSEVECYLAVIALEAFRVHTIITRAIVSRKSVYGFLLRSEMNQSVTLSRARFSMTHIFVIDSDRSLCLRFMNVIIERGLRKPLKVVNRSADNQREGCNGIIVRCCDRKKNVLYNEVG